MSPFSTGNTWTQSGSIFQPAMLVYRSVAPENKTPLSLRECRKIGSQLNCPMWKWSDNTGDQKSTKWWELGQVQLPSKWSKRLRFNWRLLKHFLNQPYEPLWALHTNKLSFDRQDQDWNDQVFCRVLDLRGCDKPWYIYYVYIYTYTIICIYY